MSAQDKIGQLCEDDKINWQNVTKQMEKINRDLSDMKFVPNNNQLGVAIAAKIKFAKKRK